jgi:hypothetical protein
MKRLFFALCVLALFAAVPSPAKAADVSVDFFYNNLGDDGSWIEVGDYGYCWQPSVAVSNSSWRPYTDGYWAYTDLGWTWVSNEDFGWATYHYGRWARLRDHGWVWVPGREWAPAWVSWRTGGDYVGWAPLPPRGGGAEVVYEGRSIDNRVDIDFGIGPAYYNFIDIRYIGEPVLRERIFQPEQNITYISRTVNVTNITYNNSTYYNYGPDYNRLSAYSTRPIRRLALQRETNVDLNVAARSGGLTKVQGDRLLVAAPAVLEKPTHSVAPKSVKEKVAQPNLEKGWAGVTDPKAKAELEQKIKTEDPKSVPPPDIKPVNPEALKGASPAASAPATSAPLVGSTPAVTASPAPSAHAGGASPGPGTTPVSGSTPTPSKDKGRRGAALLPLTTATPGTEGTPAGVGSTPAASPNESKSGKKGKRGAAAATPQPTAGAEPSAAAAQSAPGAGGKGNKGKGKAAGGPAATPHAVTSPQSAPANEAAPAQKPGGVTGKSKDAGKGKQETQQVRNPHETDPAIPAPNTAPAESAKHNAPPASKEPKQPRNQPVNPGIVPQAHPQGDQGQPPQGHDQGKPAKAKKDKAQDAPSPAPGQ